MTTQRLATSPMTLSPADLARYADATRTRIARLDDRIARANGPRRLSLQAQRSRLARNLAIYEAEVQG